MKKRLFRSLSLVLALVFCMGMTAFANGSREPKPDEGKIGEHQAGDVYGRKGERPTGYDKEIEELKGSIEDGMKVIDVQKFTVDNQNEIVWPATICFDVKGVSSNTVGYVMLLTDAGWVKLPTTMKNGQMCAQFDSTFGECVVAFVVDPATYAPTSPQTSASGAASVALLGLGAAVSAAGLKKRNK